MSTSSAATSTTAPSSSWFRAFERSRVLSLPAAFHHRVESAAIRRRYRGAPLEAVEPAEIHAAGVEPAAVEPAAVEPAHIRARSVGARSVGTPGVGTRITGAVRAGLA